MTVKTRPTSIVTYTGRRVWPVSMTVDDVIPIDVAHALSNICRYNGHVDEFYSVAQHCCLLYDRGVELNLEPLVLKELLIHDATETYCGDMVAPLKHQDEFQFYRDLEDKIHLIVCDKFELPYVFDPIVKDLDISIREAEIRDLKSGIGSTVKQKAGNQFGEITGWSPAKARSAMIKRMRKTGITV